MVGTRGADQRGGLIAALVFIALSILISGHHHRPPPPMPGWGGQAGMAYGGGYGPYPMPRPDMGWGGPCRHGGWGPRPWDGPPRSWNGPSPQGPQDQPPPPGR